MHVAVINDARQFTVTYTTSQSLKQLAILAFPHAIGQLGALFNNLVVGGDDFTSPSELAYRHLVMCAATGV